MMSDIDILITLSRESNEIPRNKNSEIGFFWLETYRKFMSINISQKVRALMVLHYNLM